MVLHCPFRTGALSKTCLQGRFLWIQHEIHQENVKPSVKWDSVRTHPGETKRKMQGKTYCPPPSAKPLVICIRFQLSLGSKNGPYSSPVLRALTAGARLHIPVKTRSKFHLCMLEWWSPWIILSPRIKGKFFKGIQNLDSQRRSSPVQHVDVCVILPAFCGFMVSGKLLKQLGAFRASCRNPKNRIATRSDAWIWRARFWSRLLLK